MFPTRFPIIPEDELYSIHRTCVQKKRPYLNRIRTAEDFHEYSFANNNRLRGMDAPRAFCLLDFQDWLTKHAVPTTDVLVTCREDPEVSLLPSTARVQEIRYENGHDLHKLDLEKKDYDFMIVSQTLEHLYHPFQAMKQCWDHLRPGGYFFTSVPTTNIPHNTPIHFQEFYPMGLATLGLQAEFDIVEIGFWGNQEYLLKLFSTYEWPDIYGLTTLVADPNYPAACWGLFRKPTQPLLFMQASS